MYMTFYCHSCVCICIYIYIYIYTHIYIYICAKKPCWSITKGKNKSEKAEGTTWKKNNNCFLAFWLRSCVKKNKGNVSLASKFADIWQSVRHLKKIKIVFQFLTIRFCPGPQAIYVCKASLFAFSNLAPYRYTQSQDICRGGHSFSFHHQASQTPLS